MLRIKILVIFILSLISNCICQRIECDWSSQYICGDKCLFLQSSCICGNETITALDAFSENLICCNEGTCLDGLSGDVKCNGVVQKCTAPCNGTCKQTPSMGLTTISCKDNEQCVIAVDLCRGVASCNE